LKALGPLAVAEKDVLAHSVRPNRACSGDYMNARRAWRDPGAPLTEDFHLTILDADPGAILSRIATSITLTHRSQRSEKRLSD